MKQLPFIYVICICLVFLFSCSKDEPTSANNSSTQYAGSWEGNTSKNQPVYFRVNQQGVIDSICVRISMSIGLGTCTANYLCTNNITIKNGEFSAPVTFGDISINFSGKFSSGNNINGSYEGFSGSFSIVCGGSLIIGSGSLFSSGTWNATKQ